MVKRSKEIQSSYHIRFNPANERHHAAAAYMKSVKDKYKTAFVAAAIEAYREAHPHGIDYQELEAIQKKSWSPFQPKAPILKNLENRREPASKGIAPNYHFLYE